MRKSFKSPIFRFCSGRWLLAAALLGMLLACGGGDGGGASGDQTDQNKLGNLEKKYDPECVSTPSQLKTANCLFPKTGSYSFRTETASCKTDTFGKPISQDQSTCVTPNLLVTMEFAQTHVIPPKGLRWYKKAIPNTNKYDWIKVADGVLWSPSATDPAADWTKTPVQVGSEVPPGYVLDVALRVTSNRNVLVLVDTGSSTVRPKNPKLQIWLDGTVQAELSLAPPENLDPTESNGPKYAQNSYSLMLDAKYVKPGLKLKVVSEDYGPSNEVAPELGADAEMAMWVLPFYLFGANETNTKTLKQIALPDAGLVEELTNVWPFKKLDIQSHRIGKIEWPYLVIAPRNNNPAYKMTTVLSNSAFDHYSSMLGIIQRLRIADGGDNLSNQYYTPFFTVDQNKKDTTQTGNGLGGGNAGVGDYLYGPAFYHEQGHAFGLSHAGENYLSSYPYYFGSVKESAWGYDMGRRVFLNRLIPQNSTQYPGCKNSGHLLSNDGNCWKQEPMQSGQTDGPKTSRFSMMSDYYTARIQQWLEGVTTSGSNNIHAYQGGKILLDSNSPTGYSRWDGIDKKRVAYTPSTESNAIYWINNGMPIRQSVPVQTIVLTHSIAGTSNVNSGAGYPYPIDQNISQIYPLIPTHTGNLITYIDPADRENISDIRPGSRGKYNNFCNNIGCDFTLRVTFSDTKVQHILLQGPVPTRTWYQPAGTMRTFTATEGDSFGTVVVNVSAENGRTATKAELLFTPTPWLSFPSSPLVLATGVFN